MRLHQQKWRRKVERPWGMQSSGRRRLDQDENVWWHLGSVIGVWRREAGPSWTRHRELVGGYQIRCWRFQGCSPTTFWAVIRVSLTGSRYELNTHQPQRLRGLTGAKLVAKDTTASGNVLRKQKIPNKTHPMVFLLAKVALDLFMLSQVCGTSWIKVLMVSWYLTYDIFWVRSERNDGTFWFFVP